MPSIESEGTQTATINTEHTLRDISGNKFYWALLDLVNMIAGDTVEIRVYTKAKSTGTSRMVYGPPDTTFSGVQDVPIQIIAAVPCPATQYKLTLKQTEGTGRNYDWSVLQQG